jgi:hypothetical protein
LFFVTAPGSSFRSIGQRVSPGAGREQLLDSSLDADHPFPGKDGEAATTKNAPDPFKHPECMTVTSQHGRPDNGTDASPFSNVELFVPLKPLDQWTKA